MQNPQLYLHSVKENELWWRKIYNVCRTYDLPQLQMSSKALWSRMRFIYQPAFFWEFLKHGCPKITHVTSFEKWIMMQMLVHKDFEPIVRTDSFIMASFFCFDVLLIFIYLLFQKARPVSAWWCKLVTQSEFHHLDVVWTLTDERCKTIIKCLKHSILVE